MAWVEGGKKTKKRSMKIVVGTREWNCTLSGSNKKKNSRVLGHSKGPTPKNKGCPQKKKDHGTLGKQTRKEGDEAGNTWGNAPKGGPAGGSE